MNLFHEFGYRAPNRVFFGIVLGGLAGVLYAGLIPSVTGALLAPEPSSHVYRILSIEVSHARFAALFFGLCCAIFVCRLISRTLLVWVATDLTSDLRVRLSRAIVQASTSNLEALGPSRLNAVLMEDVGLLVGGAQALPALLTSGVSLVGSLGFLCYLNGSVFRFVLGAIVFGMVTYQLPIWLGGRMFARARHMFDDLQEAVRGIVYGAKDLKLDRRKRNRYLTTVLEHRQTSMSRVLKLTDFVFIVAESYGDMIGFVVIGIVAFVFGNYFALDSSDLIGVVMAMLYVSGPIGAILGIIPIVARARTSINNIQRLLGDIHIDPEHGDRRLAPWRSLRLHGVEFRHPGSPDQPGFAIGPVDLEINRGEITFLAGGNGSGKSTVGKLVAGHYEPLAGTLSVDGYPLTPVDIDAYRQDVAAIFTDYFLFDRLLVDVDERTAAAAQRLLCEFGLEGKVQLSEGIFSTLALSDGQRKRLALVVALLDDKPLYIFDEWAADQDPSFKRIFYRQFLCELRSRGKAVLVISHDDRYFDVADRIVWMDAGRVRSVDVSTPAPAASAAQAEAS